jgi:membrane-associated phospholipid phosphatase
MMRNVVLAVVGSLALNAGTVQGQRVTMVATVATAPSLPAVPPVALRSLSPSSPVSIRWYHGLAALGVVALATTVDEPIQEHTQSNRTDTKDDVAYVFRQLGEPEVFLPVALAPVAVGLISGNDNILRAGGRITMSIVTAAVVTDLLKMAVGRTRPSSTDNAYDFAPFSGDDSWPSGHTTVAFAMATSVGDEIGSTPVSIVLYTAAGLTGWSRINDNRHWFSDVLAGAAIGITSAKLMNGKWKVFGIGQPRFLASPKGVAVGLSW